MGANIRDNLPKGIVIVPTMRITFLFTITITSYPIYIALIQTHAFFLVLYPPVSEHVMPGIGETQMAFAMFADGALHCSRIPRSLSFIYYL